VVKLRTIITFAVIGATAICWYYGIFDYLAFIMAIVVGTVFQYTSRLKGNILNKNIVTIVNNILSKGKCK
jgi:hypothetical protein